MLFPDMQRFEARAFLCLVLMATALFFWLLLPFFNVLLWAVVIAAVFTPINRKLLTLPQISENPDHVRELLTRLHNSFPAVQRILDKFGYDMSTLTSDLSALALSVGGSLAKYTMAFGGSAANFMTDLAICLYVAFFFVRDSRKLSATFVRIMPFGDHRERLLMSKFAGVMRATVKGSLLVAMAQGALGGLIFWILDIRAAVLWGVAMAILSLIPIVGAALIWLPTALYLLATGAYVDGIVLIAYGGGVIGLADNILRPILVRRGTRMPDYLILLSTLSGFTLFGMDGFVTGPLLAAIFITVWQIFADETTGRREPDEAADKDESAEEDAKEVSEADGRKDVGKDARKDVRKGTGDDNALQPALPAASLSAPVRPAQPVLPARVPVRRQVYSSLPPQTRARTRFFPRGSAPGSRCRPAGRAETCSGTHSGAGPESGVAAQTRTEDA